MEIPPRDLKAQAAAMDKLSFLIGNWNGEARAYQPDGSTVEYFTTDDIRFYNDGILLVIIGRTWAPGVPRDAEPVSEHISFAFYDEQEGQYHLYGYAEGQPALGRFQVVEQGEFRGFTNLGKRLLDVQMKTDGPDAWTERLKQSVDAGATWDPLFEIRFTRKK